MKRRKVWRMIWSVLVGLIVIGIATICGINAHVKQVGGSRIITPEEAAQLDDVDCIIVLGCLVRNNGEPSDMLADRLQRGVDLYKHGAAPKIIMSGDHGSDDYDEVNTMKRIAIIGGVPSEDVFMDHAGFSTYESIYRAGEIFEADKIIVVTQEYHLHRALYIARELGIEAYGVSADYRVYWNQWKRDIREVLARCKDFVVVQLKPEPTHLGEPIPVSGNGDMTND